jgi:hypothetical protein
MYTRFDHNIVIPSLAHGINDFIAIVLLRYLI